LTGEIGNEETKLRSQRELMDFGTKWLRRKNE